MFTGPHSKQVVLAARRLYEKGWLAAADGNISCRLPRNQILITPKGRPKAFLKANDLIRMPLEGKVPANASSESLMHLTIYRNCPKAMAVVHAHPPVSIAWSIAFPECRELPAECMSELILSVGQIPIVPFARPSTQQMGDNLKPFLPKCRVMILSHHGALAWGETIEEAYLGIERLEHSASVLYYSKTLGKLSELPPSEISWLRDAREKMGDRTL